MPEAFLPNDDVRLLHDHAGVRPGTLGRVLGRYARSEEPTYLVSFQSEGGCIEVRPDEIVLVP